MLISSDGADWTVIFKLRAGVESWAEDDSITFTDAGIADGTTADLYFGRTADEATNKLTGVINLIQIQYSITNDLSIDPDFFDPDGERFK